MQILICSEIIPYYKIIYNKKKKSILIHKTTLYPLGIELIYKN